MIERQEFGKSWTMDPMAAQSLPPHLHNVYRFNVLRFQVVEGSNLQETAWLRDISNMVAGDGMDPCRWPKHCSTGPFATSN